jgi:putative tryptophan/tyrosine transport system substrate-binding protein
MGTPDDREGQTRLKAFREGLADVGRREADKLRLVIRWGAADSNLIDAYAAELVELKPNILFASTTGAVKALQLQTNAIPIIFAMVTDPIGDKIVASFGNPGGNITGFATFDAAIASKWLETIKQIAPTARRVGLLFNPKTAPGGGAIFTKAAESISASVGLECLSLPVETSAQIATVLAAFASEPGGVVLVVPDAFTTTNRTAIIAAASHESLPALYPFRFFAEDGGLASYGVDAGDLFRRAGGYVDRVLRGAKPAELPVQFPAKFELVINLRTAKALGLEIAPNLVARADEVIE